jgi:hypothetical protein
MIIEYGIAMLLRIIHFSSNELKKRPH